MELDMPHPFCFLPPAGKKKDLHRKLWKTVSCTADLLWGSSLPIHGNEEFAINRALPGGSAKQKGRWCGEKDASTKLQTILNYLCLAWASSQEICRVFIGKLGQCTGKDQGEERVGIGQQYIKDNTQKQCLYSELLCVHFFFFFDIVMEHSHAYTLCFICDSGMR